MDEEEEDSRGPHCLNGEDAIACNGARVIPNPFFLTGTKTTTTIGWPGGPKSDWASSKIQ